MSVFSDFKVSLHANNLSISRKFTLKQQKYYKNMVYPKNRLFTSHIFKRTKAQYRIFTLLS